MEKLPGGMGFADLDQELSRADAESVSSDNTVASGSNGNVQVVVRVRPPSSRERDQGYAKCVGVDPAAHSATLNFRPQPRTFTFDYVADEGIGQEEIFNSVGKPITDACLLGYHCCLIAYGQTGAGKTFTMEGPDSESSSGGSPGFLGKGNVKRHEKRGLIPRILDYIFQKMAAEKTQNCKDVEFVVKCSYLQIYNEQVSDLLDPGSYNLTIHEDAKAGMYVEGLQEVVVPTSEATYGVFRRGSENRHVGMTAMNLESSRSHGVFTVVVESQRRNDGGVMNRRTSRFYLVDLAGSERQKHSESAGIRLKEAGSINKSLSALGNVIKALVDISEGKIRHVPYRDSKLTFLLKDALGGNSKCTLIANISPAEKNIDETLSTLKFAQRAKLIHNTAIVNEDMFGNPAVMGEEIRRLRLEIAALRANVGGGSGGDQNPLSGNDVQSESVRTVRLEHIISQSVKRSLEAERKNEMELHVLDLKLQATQAMCERLEKTLQSQKMIIRLRENTIKRIESGRLNVQPDEIASDTREEMEQLRKQIEHHPDVVRFKMELDLCRGQLDEYEEERKDEELLSQIAQLENLNQALKLEFQEMVDEKSTVLKEMDDARVSREAAVNQLSSCEEQFVLVREAAEKFRIEAAETHHKLEKAEEKLQEKDEVLRRADLADAQAIEYAQELTSLKSQFEKVKVAFNQQTKLQEDTFIELQRTTDEVDNSRHLISQLKAQLEESMERTTQLEAKLTEAEVERSRTSKELEEMAKECERLNNSVREKDDRFSALSDDLEQARKDSKDLDDRYTALRSEAEESQKEALHRQEELSISLSTQSAERDQALEEERKHWIESQDALQKGVDTKVQLLNSTLNERQAQVEELQKLLREQVDVLQEKENSKSTAEQEILALREQLEHVKAEFLTTQAQKDELAEEVSVKNEMLEEAKRSLTSCGEQNGTVQTALQESESKLGQCSTRLSSLESERDDLGVEKRALQAELEKKLDKLEALNTRVATLDELVTERNDKLACADEHITELKTTIEKLRAEVADTGSLRSALTAKSFEIDALRKEAVCNQPVRLAEFGNGNSNHSTASHTVEDGEGRNHLLDIPTDLEAPRSSKEENGDSTNGNEVAIPKQTHEGEQPGAVSNDLPATGDENLKSKSLDSEDLTSPVRIQAQQKREPQGTLVAQSRQVDVAEKAQRTLENNHQELVLNSRSLQDEKALMDNVASMKTTQKASEGSGDTGDAHCDIPASKSNGISAPRHGFNDANGEVTNEIAIDEEEPKGSGDEGTDARHVAALADFVNLKGHVAGSKVDLALTPHVHQYRQSLGILSKARHLEVQSMHLVKNCRELTERSGPLRISSLVSQADISNGQAARYDNFECSDSQADDQIERSPNMTFDEDMSCWPTKMLAITPSSAKTSSPSNEVMPLIMQVGANDLEGELQQSEVAFDGSVEERLAKRRMSDCQVGLLSEVTNRLGEAEGTVTEAQGKVVELEERKIELEAVLNATTVADAEDVNQAHVQRIQLLAAKQEWEHLDQELRGALKVLEAENLRLVEALGVQGTEKGRMITELELLNEKIVESEDRIAELESQRLNANRTDHSDGLHVAELDGLENALQGTGPIDYPCHLPGKFDPVNLQEFRDEVDYVQYRVGEMEYELQKHVIDTEARMIDLEKQKRLVSLEASQLIDRTSSENEKLAGMLGTLETQILDHNGRARLWVQNFNSLESDLLNLQREAVKVEGVESRVRQLEEDLQAEQKAGTEQREEVARLRARLQAEQARRSNPFSWNNNFGNTKSDSRPAHGMRSVAGVDEVVPKFGASAPQRKRTATLTRDRPAGKAKTSNTSQRGPPIERSGNDLLAIGQSGSMQQTSRASTRPRGTAAQSEKPKKYVSAARAAGQSRQPLRPLPSNNTDENPRHQPVLWREPRYNLRKLEKVQKEVSTLTPEPPRNTKRRRLM